MARLTGIRFWEIWVPRAIVALALTVGLLLAAMIGYIHVSVTQATDALVRGQAIDFLNAAHEALRGQAGRGGRPQPGVFDDLLARFRDQGLRYVALLGPDGRPEVAAGEPSGPIERDMLLGTPPLVPRRTGQRYRMHTLPPPPPELHGGPPDPRREPPGEVDHPNPVPPPMNGYGFGGYGSGAPPADVGAPRPPIPRGPPPIVIEFEPMQAVAVQTLARRSVWGGAVAVPLFIVGGIALAYLARQRERLSQRIEQGRRLAALGEMSAVIAHEIRNPLASLKGHAQLLSESLNTDGRQAKADRVVHDAVRLQELVSDLLDFSRSGSLERRSVDPASVLHDAAEEVDASRIVEETTGAPEAWLLDAPHMKQALTNVLRNAVQASPDGEPVRAAVFGNGGQLVFEVLDHGPGIPAGEEEKIFEPFHTRKTRGTGLGLAVARRIVAQHGGTVVARNTPRGTVFRLSIPRG